MISVEDRKKALSTPGSVFRHPADVVDSRDFDKDEKAAILRQWELDARLLQVASEEGMSKGERSLLADVKKAQERLHVPALKEDGVPTKSGP